jgi:cysteine desulfurase
MREIADICHAKGALLHSDATQAVGRIPVDVREADVDLISATAHKFYGPKGTGFLVVGNGARRVRIKPQIVGGGQQHNLRSGTMNPAGVIGITTALRLCVEQMDETQRRVRQLRDDLFEILSRQIDDLMVNGPDLRRADRLPGNLNMVLPAIEGAAWIAATPNLAFSSGSACSSTESKPSHVLTAIGLDESEARRSVRFGVGRFNTADDIQIASEQLVDSYRKVEAIGH